MDDMMEMKEHLESHITYPATKTDIMRACNDMSHVPNEHKKMFLENLPDETYQSSDAVMQAANMM